MIQAWARADQTQAGSRAMQVSVFFWEMETRLGLLQTWLSVSGLRSEPESFSILTWVTTFQGWKKHIHNWLYTKEGLQTNNGEFHKCWVNKTNFISPSPPAQTNPQEQRPNLTIWQYSLHRLGRTHTQVTWCPACVLLVTKDIFVIIDAILLQLVNVNSCGRFNYSRQIHKIKQDEVF